MVSSFCYCSRNSDAEHRGKRPFDLPTNNTALVTLRWRYFHRCTLTNKTLTFSLLERSKKIVTTFSRLPGKPWRLLTTDNSLQETDTYRQITGRFILQLDITQSHNYQNSYVTSTTSMQYDRQLNKYLDREEDFIQRNTHRPTTSTEANDNTTPTTTTTIPHIKGMSENVSRILQTIRYLHRSQTYYHTTSVTD